MTSAETHDRNYLLTLALGALGVVYGDIGTSPLYALRECFAPHYGRRIVPHAGNVLGILSLIAWSLVIVISIKYIVFVMRADNRGEGGILALMSLVRPKASRRRGMLIALGLFGSALLYGDGMITPAISVLSAMEGLEVATPLFTHWVVPLTVIVLIILFMFQKHGTAKVGAFFGPVMLVWFILLAALGIINIVHDPRVLAAVNPAHAIRFLFTHRSAGFLVLGAVFLAVTGGEALYADMGHFGARPIRIAWFVLVFPSLLLNYFGQGALLLDNPKAVSNPFFHMAPDWALYPLVALSTIATVIASQAVISGSFSLTRQAAQLGYLPRIQIRHTSAREIGQIYVPSVNWLLMISAVGLVIGFRASTALAGAYGVAVTATMAITTMLLAIVARERWKWPLLAVLALAVPFLIIDFAFFGANIVKVLEGGWFPLLVGIATFTVMTTWRRGRLILSDRIAETAITEEDFLRDLAAKRIPRVAGVAIFLTRTMKGIPTALLHNLKHNKVVHEKVVLLTVDIEETPTLGEHERYEWRDLGWGVYRLHVHFGFMEDPDLPALIARIDKPFPLKPMATSYFLGREMLIPTRRPGMAIWREHLFAWMNRNSASASIFFDLPANQVIELGAQVEM
ncbi:MAG TPA: potassium transporter Kup [Thermoanaerobaculia bacterium]|nr:potassium transporter Kup [Thermoanaerobaculia bacterium]